MNDSKLEGNNPGSSKSKPNKQERPKGNSARGRTTIWTTIITAIGSLLIAVVGTVGTIVAKKSDLRDINDQIPKVKSDLAIAKTEAAQTLSATKGLSVPVGTILPYGGPVNKANEDMLINDGWLPCDGREVRQDNYPLLYKKIRDSWGNGNRVDTFNLPDLRGLFLRGVDDDESNNDPDRGSRTDKGKNRKGPVVGSYQPDAFGSHAHSFNYGRITNKTDKVKPADSFASGNNDSIYQLPTAMLTTKTDGNETRPKNAYVHYIIKFQ